MKNEQFQYQTGSYSWLMVAEKGTEYRASLSPQPRAANKRSQFPNSTTMNRQQMIRLIRNGLPVTAFNSLQTELAVSATLLASVIHVAARTLARRKIEGKFRPDESERILRIARLYEKAITVLEGRDQARQWLKTPQKGLGGAIPIEYADTEIGAQEVFDLLGRLEHGVFT